MRCWLQIICDAQDALHGEVADVGLIAVDVLFRYLFLRCEVIDNGAVITPEFDGLLFGNLALIVEAVGKHHIAGCGGYALIDDLREPDDKNDDIVFVAVGELAWECVYIYLERAAGQLGGKVDRVGIAEKGALNDAHGIIGIELAVEALFCAPIKYGGDEVAGALLHVDDGLLYVWAGVGNFDTRDGWDEGCIGSVVRLGDELSIPLGGSAGREGYDGYKKE